MEANVSVIVNHEETNEDIQFINGSLRDFNLKMAPPVQEPIAEHINLILKNDAGEVIGGLLGVMYRYCYALNILWVDERYRKFGYGRKLMQQVEEILRHKGCSFIHLDTFSFQAPGFYQKNGYEVFGVLDGYTDGISRYYLKKNL